MGPSACMFLAQEYSITATSFISSSILLSLTHFFPGISDLLWVLKLTFSPFVACVLGLYCLDGINHGVCTRFYPKPIQKFLVQEAMEVSQCMFGDQTQISYVGDNWC